MDNKNLIDSLVNDLEAKPPLKSPLLRWLLWFAVSFSSVSILMIVVQSFRPGFFGQLEMPLFLLETVFAFASAASCAYLAHVMVIPGRKVTRVHYALALAPFAAFLVTLGYGAMSGPPSFNPTNHYRATCLWEIVGLSWIPLIVLSWQLRKAYPFFYSRTGFLVGLASSALPVSLMQFACIHDPGHTLAFHVLPALGVTFVAILLSRFLLRPAKSNAPVETNEN